MYLLTPVSVASYCFYSLCIVFRFDHSPCDPTISLHGVGDSSYVCLVCQERFLTTEEYSVHLNTKVRGGRNDFTVVKVHFISLYVNSTKCLFSLIGSL